jgi:exopolysaccharide biosynthesis protein
LKGTRERLKYNQCSPGTTTEIVVYSVFTWKGGFMAYPRSVLVTIAITSAVCGWSPGLLLADLIVTNPFVGVTLITRTETSPRTEHIHIAEINLTAPGIHFELTPPGGTLESVRQTTVSFLNQEHAQLAINGHFFLPFPSSDINAMLIGLAVSNGNVYSSFEAPVQSYALVTNAPALNIDSSNHPGIVHDDTTFADGKHVIENVVLWTALAGSAQIITNGVVSIPTYLDATHPDGLLTPGGPGSYSNSNSWYNLINARTVIGLSQDSQTLFLFTVDSAGGSRGMTVAEVANLLLNEYGVYNALNLDGGGSTTMALQNPVTGVGSIINVSSDNPNGRAVGSNLAIFATSVPEPSSFALTGLVLIAIIAAKRTRSTA